MIHTLTSLVKSPKASSEILALAWLRIPLFQSQIHLFQSQLPITYQCIRQYRSAQFGRYQWCSGESKLIHQI